MKLYLVHCGFYDPDLFDGVYESHVNFFVVAESFEDARAKAKANPEYKTRKMHVDGLQELEAIDGFRVTVKEDAKLDGKTLIQSARYRSLAPKPSNQ